MKAQSILAPAFVHLKNQFEGIGAAFIDITGTWKITVTVGTGDGGPSDRVSVKHSKGAKSADFAAKSTYEFIWELTMVCSRFFTDYSHVVTGF